MLKMSFYNGTLDRVKAKSIILESNKLCIYTLVICYGLIYRKPTTYRKPITKEKAIRIIEDDDLLNITEEDDVFHLTEYSSNDMW